MATRRSTRIAKATLEGKSEAEISSKKSNSSQPPAEPAVNTKKAKQTRRKRVREDEENEENPPKPKKQQLDAQIPSIPSSYVKPDTTKPASSEHAQDTFWLLKAEPESRIENGVDVKFSINDLATCTEPEPWSGVRNYQARNNMMAMKEGDLALFYHSNAKPSGVVGIMKIVKEAVVDESAFDPKDPYYDPKSSREKPKWFCVHVEFVRKFPNIIDLQTLKGFAAPGKPLEKMQLVTASRLSVSKVTKDEWEFILGLADAKKE